MPPLQFEPAILEVTPGLAASAPTDYINKVATTGRAVVSTTLVGFVTIREYRVPKLSEQDSPNQFSGLNGASRHTGVTVFVMSMTEQIRRV